MDAAEHEAVRQLYEAARSGKDRLLRVFGELVAAEAIQLLPSDRVAREDLKLSDHSASASEVLELELEMGGYSQNRMLIRFAENLQTPQSRQQKVSAGLIMHFQQAWQLCCQLSNYDYLQENMRSVLDHYPAPLMAFNSSFELVYQNGSAEEWLQSSENMALINDNFAASVEAGRSSDYQQLSRLTFDDGRSVLVISRAEWRRAERHLGEQQEARVAKADIFFWLHVLIIRPTTQIRQYLQQILGLTQAERHLACHLLNGLPIKDFAVDRNVADSTVRKQLKTIMKKQGVHSQEELIQALHESCLALAMSGGRII